MEKLELLGFSDWFRQQIDADQSAIHEIARVVAVHKDSFVVSKGNGEVFAECAGNLLYSSNSPLDLPTTGDWVLADFYDEDAHAIIHRVLSRKTLLKRKTAGRRVDFQLIAANIDVAFIMQSVDHNFNLRRLERYLAMIGESNITPIILLSKCDLISAAETAEIEKRIAAIAPAISVLPFSNVTRQNISPLQASLSAGKTYCLVGSSGVGKTTLLNTIIGRDQFQTREVSKRQGKGRHTTTSRELVQLESGALLIDTPGMRELGNIAIDAGIDETFSEISELTMRCQFRDCSHTTEKGCAVMAAVASGELDEQRFKSYVKLKNESAFLEMSYYEKRKKDKEFGKMVKAVMKGKKKR